MNYILSEYINDIPFLKKINSLFSLALGFEIGIFPFTGASLKFACSLKENKSSPCSKNNQENCNRIPESFISQINTDNKDSVFVCPAGLRKRLSPIILKDEVVAFLIIGENESFKFNGARTDALIKTVSEINSYIIQTELNTLRHFHGNSGSYKQHLINRVTEYIRSNIRTNNISLKKAAQDNGISYHYLSHLFKDTLKTTFVEYRRKLKMEMAVQLLRDFRLTVNQVSDVSGFDDPSYFSKVFKASHGYPPGVFRRKILSIQRPTHEPKQKNTIKKQMRPLTRSASVVKMSFLENDDV